VRNNYKIVGMVWKVLGMVDLGMSGLDIAGDPHGINPKRYQVRQKYIGWCL